MTVTRTTEVPVEELEESRRLVAVLRRLMHAAARTGAGAEEKRRIAGRIEDLIEELEPGVRRGALRLPVDAPLQARLAAEPLPAGVDSPFAIPLAIEFSEDGRTARAEFTADSLLEGPLTAVHGGIIAWIFDVILGVLVQAQGGSAVTRSLEVEYLRPTPLGVPLMIEAQLGETEAARFPVVGTITAAGKVTARSSGLFVVPTHMPGQRPDAASSAVARG